MRNEEFPQNDTDNLDNIILQQNEKREKIKKYALLVGSLVLVFIIVLTIVKLLNNTTPNYQEALNDDQKFLQESEIDEENFQEVPIQKSDVTVESIKIAPSKPKKEDLKQKIQEVKEELAKTAPKTVKEAPTKVEEKSQNRAKITSKSKAATKPKLSSKKAKTKSSKKATSNIYIQVGAFLHSNPDKKLLSKIKKMGFSYVVKRFNINGKRIKRVYVGPFASKKEAKEALVKVRRSINKQAFITRIR